MKISHYVIAATIDGHTKYSIGGRTDYPQFTGDDALAWKFSTMDDAHGYSRTMLTKHVLMVVGIPSLGGLAAPALAPVALLPDDELVEARADAEEARKAYAAACLVANEANITANNLERAVNHADARVAALIAR